jgi:hypothetical protein
MDDEMKGGIRTAINVDTTSNPTRPTNSGFPPKNDVSHTHHKLERIPHSQQELVKPTAKPQQKPRRKVTIKTTNSGCPPTNNPSLVGEDTPQELEPTAQSQQKPRRNIAIKNMSTHFDHTICCKPQTCNPSHSLCSYTDHSITLLWDRGGCIWT